MKKKYKPFINKRELAEQISRGGAVPEEVENLLEAVCKDAKSIRIRVITGNSYDDSKLAYFADD